MSSPTFWVIGNGADARLGDTVTLADDTTGPIVGVTVNGYPVVRPDAGEHAGIPLGVHPRDIVSRVRREAPEREPTERERFGF
jgi:hypothetical protein